MTFTTREAVTVLLAALLAACSSGAPAPAPGAPAGKVLLATFSGELDTRSGTFTIRADDAHVPGASRALAEITGVSVANDGGAAPTPGTDCTGGSSSLSVSVRIKADPYVSTTLWTNVYAQIQSMTPATGFGGCNNATLPDGLTDYGMGLWYYPSLGGSNGVKAVWAFANPTGTSFTFAGKVYGTAVTVGDIKSVFVTSTAYDGNLGGISGADAKCQARAGVGIDARNLASGNYWAFLATGSQDPFSMLPEAAFVRPDGVIVAGSKAALNPTSILESISVTENNEARYDYVWTGPGSSCLDWTNADFPNSGTIGISWQADNSTWFNFTNNFCDSSYSLYCFQQ